MSVSQDPEYWRRRYERLLQTHKECVWDRCPGCGRYSCYKTPPWWKEEKGEWTGDYHSDGCPLEGMYGHQHRWWFEREIADLKEEIDLVAEQRDMIAEQCDKYEARIVELEDMLGILGD